MLSKLLKAVAEFYSMDPTTAGIVQAYLPQRGSYYASVVRYHRCHGEMKEVIAKTEAGTPELAVEELSRAWLNRIGRSPAIDDLVLAIKAV